MWTTSTSHRAYVRELPGGGFVAIDVRATRTMLHGRSYDGAVIVERRANWRRAGHTPPVVALVTGDDEEAVVRQLLPIAQSNAAIGAAILARDPVARDSASR